MNSIRDGKSERWLDKLAEANADAFGSCGHCQLIVTNDDPNHRVTPILKGGRGVECKLRGDYL